MWNLIIVENRQTSEQQHNDSNCQLPEPDCVCPLWRHCVPRSQQPHVRLSGSVSSARLHATNWLWRHHADGVLPTEGRQTLHLHVHRHYWQHDILSCCWLLSGDGGQRTGAGVVHRSDQVQRSVYNLFNVVRLPNLVFFATDGESIVSVYSNVLVCKTVNQKDNFLPRIPCDRNKQTNRDLCPKVKLYTVAA